MHLCRDKDKYTLSFSKTSSLLGFVIGIKSKEAPVLNLHEKKIKISEAQEIIDKYRLAANIPKFMIIRQLFLVKMYVEINKNMFWS